MSLLTLELSKAGFEGGQQRPLLPAIHHDTDLLAGADVGHDGQHQLLQPLRNHVVLFQAYLRQQVKQLLQVYLRPLEVPTSAKLYLVSMYISARVYTDTILVRLRLA